MKKVKYSIIVPVYNAGAYLSKAIESVLDQNYEDWELLLIDDGSTDNSKQICEFYQRQDVRIKTIFKSNEGVSVARNVGIEQAMGEFIVFLDADDWVAKDYLGISNRILDETFADLLILNHSEVKGDYATRGIEISETLCTGVHENKDELIKFTLELASGDSEKWYGLMRPVWAKVFRKKLIEENDIKFDSQLKYGEDTAFLLAYLTVTNKIAYRNEYLYYYRNNVSSAMNNKKWEGSSHGEHYFSVVENTVKNHTTEESLAKFWFNISENDWRVLSKEKISYKIKRKEMINLFSSSLYRRFTKKTVTGKFNRKQQIEAFFVRHYCYDALFFMYYLLEKKKKGKRVFVHFFSEKNYGDDVFVYMLLSHYPNNKFIISGDNNNLVAFKNQNNIIVHNDNKLILKINKVIKKIAKIDLLYYIHAYKCDICLTIGGSIFIEPKKQYLNTYLRDKKCKFYPKKKNVILGANFGPYSSCEFVDFFNEDFERYDLVTFRDWDSYNQFRNVPCVKYAPDILFGLESIYKEEKNYQKLFQQDYIVISVIDAAKDRNAYINKITKIIQYYDTCGFLCVLLSLCHKQGDFDLCNEIRDKSCTDTKILDYNGDIQSVMKCIKDAKYVIASRFHAIVTSLVFNVPCFPVIYSNKTSNMLNDIGFGGYSCEIDALSVASLKNIDFNRMQSYVMDIEDIKKQSERHFEEFDKCLY